MIVNGWTEYRIRFWDAESRPHQWTRFAPNIYHAHESVKAVLDGEYPGWKYLSTEKVTP